jgi:hypothetical protein
MSWLRAQERTRSLLEYSKKSTGWIKKEPDNKFKEFSEQSEKSDYDFKRSKIPLKQRMQQKTIKS